MTSIQSLKYPYRELEGFVELPGIPGKTPNDEERSDEEAGENLFSNEKDTMEQEKIKQLEELKKKSLSYLTKLDNITQEDIDHIFYSNEWIEDSLREFDEYNLQFHQIIGMIEKLRQRVIGKYYKEIEESKKRREMAKKEG